MKEMLEFGKEERERAVERECGSVILLLGKEEDY
jgi:hypothetical protein